MAATQLTPISLTSAGVELKSNTGAYTAATTDTVYWVNDGKTFLHVVNGGGVTCVVTVDSPQSCDQSGTHDVTVSVPAGDDYIIGPFEKSRFNASDTGYITVDFDQVASVTVAAYQY